MGSVVRALVLADTHVSEGSTRQLPDQVWAAMSDVDVVLADVPIALVHETGTTAGRERRMQKWFPDARVVIFGHSHMPCNRWVDRQLLFNPGSSTWKRTAPSHTYGVLEFAAGEVIRHEIVAIAQRTA